LLCLEPEGCEPPAGREGDGGRGIELIQDQRGNIDYVTQPLLVRAQGLFGASKRRALFALAQGPLDRGHEPGEALFHHVIGRPLFQSLNGGFLPQRPRDEDERQLRAALLRESERREAIEGGQRIIAQDQIKGPPLERFHERLAGLHPLPRARDPGARQHGFNQLRVVGIVFDQQDPVHLIHALPSSRSGSEK
jgi:hypothetical protein